MIREIDSRTIPSSGVTVELVMDTGGPAETYYVFVKDRSGRNVTTIGAHTRSGAINAYHHPFSFQQTPNVFAGDDGSLMGPVPEWDGDAEDPPVR
jgi:hypothetical protein